ncbi:DUF421 domain-containing protein [Massilia antarctica]|uniref:DUF421 domain-containing protein n=1 Tax=Massilia antarctica TaxID=2765360 RepID=A0AA48WC52_9BURK|nr:YetF domain-containing protein [Massilia antarctica]QPI49860.1 DUF421 domain-containing protein [Massilia antarctica]
MFEMSHPWWEFVMRGAAVYLILMVMVRVSGRRTVGQFTPFDLLVVMLLSEAVSNSLTGGDQSLIGGFIVAAVLVGLNMTMSFLSSRSQTMSDILDGSAVLLGRDGELYDKVMKRCRISREEVDQALRSSDCDIKDMRCAFLEADGQITIQKK